MHDRQIYYDTETIIKLYIKLNSAVLSFISS